MVGVIVVFVLGFSSLLLGALTIQDRFGIAGAMQSWNASVPGFRRTYGEMKESSFRRLMGIPMIIFGLLCIAAGIAAVAGVI